MRARSRTFGWNSLRPVGVASLPCDTKLVSHDFGIMNSETARAKRTMKKLLTLALGVSLLGGLTPALVRAADADSGNKKRPKPTEEQRKLRKELLDKYDTNKDHKLDKEERAKMSKEDQEKLEKAGLGHQAKKAKKAEKSDKKDSSK